MLLTDKNVRDRIVSLSGERGKRSQKKEESAGPSKHGLSSDGEQLQAMTNQTLKLAPPSCMTKEKKKQQQQRSSSSSGKFTRETNAATNSHCPRCKASQALKHHHIHQIVAHLCLYPIPQAPQP